MTAIDNVLEKLRNHGERLTIQRRIVIETLAAAGTHVTIPEIQHAIQQKDVELDYATIYRILEKFIDLGIVYRTDIGVSGVVYELMDDDPHHHLICLSCGTVTRIPDDVFCAVRTQLQVDYAFQPRMEHMAIFGYCRACQEKQAPDANGV